MRSINYSLMTTVGLAALLFLLPVAAASAQQSVPNETAPAPVGAVGGTAMPTGAPEAPPAADPGSDGANADIVVTAQRRAQRLQDVPVAVSVVSGATLARSNLTSLESIAARLPDVKISSGPLVDQINIRGVGSGQNSGFEQSVATFVDGVYRSRSRASRAALFDIDQVEVLKGPQTTFFGANAIAGALNITTRKPGDSFAYNISGLYAIEDGEYNVEAGMDVPASDTFAVRLSGRVAGMGGYTRNVLTGNDGPRDRYYQGRIAARWRASSAFRSDLRFDIGRSRTRDAFLFEAHNCPAGAPFVISAVNTCARSAAANGGVSRNTTDYHSAAPSNDAAYDFYEAAWTNSLDLGSGSVTAITGYFHHKYNEHIQTIPFPVAGTVNGYDALPVYLGEKYHQFSQEVRYQSASGGTFEYMFGGYYQQGNLSTFNNVGFFFLPFGAFNPTGTTSATTAVTGRPRLFQKDHTLSGFASATIRPFEGFRINLGARYTSVVKRGTHDVTFGTSVNAAPSTYVPFSAATNAVFASILGADLTNFLQPKRIDNKFMPSAGIQYDVVQNVMAYATYSKGFKAGGFSASSLANEFAPENVNAYEVGLKGQFLDRRLTVNTALFRSDYRNLQEATIVYAPSGTIVSLVQNVASSRAQGVELGASYRFSPFFSISTDVAYLDSKYRSYPSGPCTITGNALTANCSQDLSGKRRPYAPKWSGNIGASARYPIGDYEIRLDPSLYFSLKYFEEATADPITQQKAYAKIDARLGFGPQDQRWEIAIVGKNLTDKATAGYRNPLTLSPGSYISLPDRPRAVAIQVSVKG